MEAISRRSCTAITANAGLDVKILPGAASSAVLQRVARNQVAFGVENADRILLGPCNKPT